MAKKKSLKDANVDLALDTLENTQIRGIAYSDDDHRAIVDAHTLNSDVIEMEKLELEREKFAYQKKKDEREAKNSTIKTVAGAVAKGIGTVLLFGYGWIVFDVEKNSTVFNGTSSGKAWMDIFKKKI